MSAMRPPITAILAAALLATAVLTAPPTRAEDPVDRAIRRLNELTPTSERAAAAAAIATDRATRLLDEATIDYANTLIAFADKYGQADPAALATLELELMEFGANAHLQMVADYRKMCATYEQSGWMLNNTACPSLDQNAAFLEQVRAQAAAELERRKP